MECKGKVILPNHKVYSLHPNCDEARKYGQLYTVNSQNEGHNLSQSYISSRGTKKRQLGSYRRRKAINASKAKKSQQTTVARKKAILRPPR